jgi:hypothetical protein
MAERRRESRNDELVGRSEWGQRHPGLGVKDNLGSQGQTHLKLNSHFTSYYFLCTVSLSISIPLFIFSNTFYSCHSPTFAFLDLFTPFSISHFYSPSSSLLPT